MIIYFTATKNSQHIAEKIALETKDKAISMTDIKEEITLSEGENLGIVCPVYFWGLPSYVKTFLSRVKVENGENAYVYIVLTYGGTVGQADYYANKLLKLNASYAIKTVDNYTIWFDATDKDKINKALLEEEKQLKDVIEDIKAKKEVFIKKDKKSRLMCWGARLSYEASRKTKKFKALDRCTGCGICERGCPEKAIKLKDGKPYWVKDKCSFCLKCLHNCPEFAIQAGNKTEKNGQYIHP